MVYIFGLSPRAVASRLALSRSSLTYIVLRRAVRMLHSPRHFLHPADIPAQQVLRCADDVTNFSRAGLDAELPSTSELLQ